MSEGTNTSEIDCSLRGIAARLRRLAECGYYQWGIRQAWDDAGVCDAVAREVAGPATAGGGQCVGVDPAAPGSDWAVVYTFGGGYAGLDMRPTNWPVPSVAEVASGIAVGGPPQTSDELLLSFAVAPGAEPVKVLVNPGQSVAVFRGAVLAGELGGLRARAEKAESERDAALVARQTFSGAYLELARKHSDAVQELDQVIAERCRETDRARKLEQQLAAAQAELDRIRAKVHNDEAMAAAYKRQRGLRLPLGELGVFRAGAEWAVQP